MKRPPQIDGRFLDSFRMKLRIFCDFDGTVAVNDVGNLVFTTFGNPDQWWELVRAWREKKIDGRDLWQRQAAGTHISEKDLDAFAAGQPLDPFFKNFYRFCLQNDVPLCILSDGMDVYIQRILTLNGLNSIVLFANHMVINHDHTIHVEFPYYHQGCGVCANCKGMQIRQQRLPGETAVYVGDGFSDLCAIKEADILFAKKELRSYCEQNNIPFIPFQTFWDVQNKIKDLIKPPRSH